MHSMAWQTLNLGSRGEPPFFSTMRLLDLPEDLLEQILEKLDPLDLARLETVCRPLGAVATRVLEPWRALPDSDTTPDGPRAVELLHHVRALKRELSGRTSPRADEFRWHMAKARCEYLRRHCGVKCRLQSFSMTRNMVLSLGGWTIRLELQQPGGLTRLVAWRGSGHGFGYVASAGIAYDPDLGWHMAGQGELEDRIFEIMSRDLAGGGPVEIVPWEEL